MWRLAHWQGGQQSFLNMILMVLVVYQGIAGLASSIVLDQPMEHRGMAGIRVSQEDRSTHRGELLASVSSQKDRGPTKGPGTRGPRHQGSKTKGPGDQQTTG